MNFVFYICNFNTTSMTNTCINSIRQFYDNEIYILDNSDVERFSTTIENVKIIDNFNDNLLHIHNEISKMPTVKSNNNYASWKHSFSIQWIINNTRNNFVLMDSDTELIKNFDEIFNDIDNSVITICDMEVHDQFSPRINCKWSYKTRFMPVFQFFNVNNTFFKEKLIIYHNPLCISGGQFGGYDTGAYFYEQCTCNKIKYKQINHLDYVYHKNHGSWKP